MGQKYQDMELDMFLGVLRNDQVCRKRKNALTLRAAAADRLEEQAEAFTEDLVERMKQNLATLEMCIKLNDILIEHQNHIRRIYTYALENENKELEEMCYVPNIILETLEGDEVRVFDPETLATFACEADELGLPVSEYIAAKQTALDALAREMLNDLREELEED